MGSTQELLNDYLTKSRAGHEKAERSETVRRIEAVFDELKLPWRREADGSGWEIDSDVGQVQAGLDDDEEILTLFQLINTVSDKPKKQGEFFYALLKANANTTGACFAIRENDETPEPYLFVVGRIAATKVDSEEVALALQSVFFLSSHFD